MSTNTQGKEDIFRELGPLALGSWMRRVSEELFCQVEEVYEAHNIGLKPSLFPCFIAVSQSGPLSITEIAKQIGVSHPAVHKMARELLSEKLLLEKRDPMDERKRMLMLSKKGERLLTSIGPVWTELRRAVENALPRAADNFIEQFEKFEENIRERTMLERVERAKNSIGQNVELAPESVEIITYAPKLARDFYTLNAEWIESYFELEDRDKELLQNPEEYVIRGGGEIFFAIAQDEDGDEKALGTVAMIPGCDESGLTFELTKMAVEPTAQGLGIGKRLMESAIEFARGKGARKIWLESNSVLKSAVGMYEKFGFQHLPLRKGSSYSRADVHMEMKL